MSATVTVARGNLYLSRTVCESYFEGLDGIVLQRRADDLLVLPVRHAASGGYVLKYRNARGDRVVSAADFFRIHGLDDERELQAPARWDRSAAALLVPGVFRN